MIYAVVLMCVVILAVVYKILAGPIFGDDARESIATSHEECAACGTPCTGVNTIHRDGFGIGPDVALCKVCASTDGPTCEELWRQIKKRRSAKRATILRSMSQACREAAEQESDPAAAGELYRRADAWERAAIRHETEEERATYE